MSYEPSDEALEQNPTAGIKDRGHKPKLGEPRGVNLRELRQATAEARTLDAEEPDDDATGDFDVEEDVDDLRARWNDQPAKPAPKPAQAPPVSSRGEVWQRFACAILAAGCADMGAAAKASDKLLQLYEARRF